MNRHFERNVTRAPLYWCGAYTKTACRCRCVRPCVCEWVYGMCVFFVCDSENGLKYVYIIKHSVLCCCFRYFFPFFLSSLHTSIRWKEREMESNRLDGWFGWCRWYHSNQLKKYNGIERENGNNNSRDKRHIRTSCREFFLVKTTQMIANSLEIS